MNFIMHPDERAASIRPPSNDERYAQWAAQFYSAGYHRAPEYRQPEPQRESVK